MKKTQFSDYKVISLADRYDLFEKQDEICEEAWPEFILHHPIIDEYWMSFINAFKEYQLLIIKDDEIYVIINSVPLNLDIQLDSLPKEGWDWGIKKSIDDYNARKQPNALMGVEIVVNKKHQGKGLSSLAVIEMLDLSKRKKFKSLIVPVRPSLKHLYPLTAMENYIKWTNKDNLPFDAWLRVHVKLGGKIVKVCSESMKISGNVSEWEQWTKLKFPETNDYVISGGLNPLLIDKERDKGIYIEPNVWIFHQIRS